MTKFANIFKVSILDVSPKQIAILVLAAALLFVVAGVLLCSKAKAEFSAPPMSIPGKAFGWNICIETSGSAQMSCASNDFNITSAKLPPIVIGNGEDVTPVAKAANHTAPQAGNVTITVFGR